MFKLLTMTIKGQMWYSDFILAVTIFTLVLVLSFKYITTDYFISGQDTNIVLSDVTRLSETLLTPGIPHNWTEDYVVMIGVTSNNILNSTKIDMLKNMSINNYAQVKSTLGLKSDFLLYFENNTGHEINITNQTYIGKPGLTKQDVQTLAPDNVITVNRYSVYKHDNISEIVGMKVMAWLE